MGNNKKSENDLNLLFRVILGLGIFGNIIGIIKCIILLMTSETWQIGDVTLNYTNHLLDSLELVCCILTIVAIIYIRKLKKWAVYLYFGQFVATAVITYCLTGDGSVFIPCAVACIIARLLFMLSKNGISAWQLIFDDDLDDDME